MKKKIHKILGVGLTLVMVLSLAVALSPVVSADPDELEWSKMDFPKAGVDGDYFRDTTISAVGPIAKAIDGSLFAYADGLNELLKSEDDGRTWTKTKYTTAGGGDIVAIVPSSEDADIVYVASATKVWKSTDVGSSTKWKVQAEDSLTTLLTDDNIVGAELITSLDVGFIDGDGYIFVGTAEAGQYSGGVYFLSEVGYGTTWQDLGVDQNTANTDLDVYSIATAPDFETTFQVIAVVTDAGGTWVVNNVGTPGTWFDDVELKESEINSFKSIAASRIGFPSDFDSEDDYELFVGVVSATGEEVGSGDVYRVLASIAYDLDVDSIAAADGIGSLDVVGAIGNVSLLAGVYGANEVHRSTDDGGTWSATKKAPTGTTKTYVLMPDDFEDTEEAWAATRGDGTAAFSLTRDGGKLWNQISLIATDLYTVEDLTFGSDRFMATLSTDIAYQAPVSAINPDEFTITETSGIAGAIGSITSGSIAVTTTGTYDSGTGVWAIDASGTVVVTATSDNTTGTWALTSGAASAAITYDADVTDDSWVDATPGSFSLPDDLVPAVDEVVAVVGTNSLWRFASDWERVWAESLAGGAFDLVQVSPEYATDSTVFVAGSSTASIWRSTDSGDQFTALATEPGAINTITAWVVIDDTTIISSDGTDIWKTSDRGRTPWKDKGTADIRSFALSPDFDDDETIIAGDDLGVVRDSTDAGDSWSTVGTTVLPSDVTYVAFDPDFADNETIYAAAGAEVARYSSSWKEILTTSSISTFDEASGLVCSPDGTLYVTDDNGFKGMARSLDPRASTEADAEWENVIEDITVNLDTLWLSAGSNVLWALDKDEADVWTYEDTLTGSPSLSGPSNRSSSERVDSVTLSWSAMDGAVRYEIKVNTMDNFRGVATTIAESPTKSTSVLVSNLEDGTTYYWKVRVDAGDPVLSRWSSVWSFTTAMGEGEWNPFVGGVPESPGNGATGVPLMPTFAWNAADWATGYEFVLADNAGFTSPIISKTLDGTVYLSEQELAYSTSYYWRVRAVSATSSSEWGTAVFTTMAKAVAPAPPATITQPAPAPIVLPTPIPPALLWTIIGIGALLVIAVIVLIVRTRRPV